MKDRSIFISIFLFFLISFSFNSLNQGFAQDDPVHLSISVQQADALIKEYADSSNFVIMDIRTEGEYAGGFIEGAINHNYYGASFDDTLESLDKTMVYLIYCASGGRSTGAFNKMKTLNFETVYNMLGGVRAWTNAGYPLVTEGTGIDVFEFNPVVVQLYPNPITSESKFVFLDIFTEQVEVKLMNMTGQIIDQFELEPGSQHPISSYKLVEGVYFFQVYLDGEIVQTNKFLKTR